MRVTQCVSVCVCVFDCDSSLQISMISSKKAQTGGRVVRGFHSWECYSDKRDGGRQGEVEKEKEGREGGGEIGRAHV